MKFLVFIETDNGAAHASSWEALGKALSLSDDVNALVIGHNVADVAAEATARGASTVYVVDDASRNSFDLDLAAADASAALEASGATAFLAVHTINGRDLAAALAADHNAGFVADCLDLALDGDALVGTRPVYSGNILCDAKAASALQIATLRPRSAEAAANTGASGEIVSLAPAAATPRVEILNEQHAESGEISLTDASIIVSGGRGVAKDPELGFRLIRELADTLGAAVGASRAAVDAGYIEYKHQVGQTGKVVRPDLYIACGISGAVQHLAGMGSSKIIVAINKDSEAPIFSVANYGIVGDLFDVVPAMNAAAKAKLNQ